MAQFVTIDRDESLSADLRVVGVGGGGCNAIESMLKRGLTGVQYVAVNTDSQVLTRSSADYKIQVGVNLTKGLGAGADPNIGRQAVEEDREKIEEALKGSDMVFVTAGMGGGTGTGGAPIIASIAKSLGSLVIGIVTKPFRWEGKKRMINAEEGIHELRQYVDSLIVIPNDRLLNILDKTVSANAAFDKPNEVLFEATRGIADIITIPGIINVDFADVRAVMSESGEALMGCGIASGENRAVEAARKAINSPLLEGINIKGAKRILLNVSGSSSLTLDEINKGNEIIFEEAGEEANVIFGWVNKEEMNEYVSYTVIATGFDGKENTKEFFDVQKTESKPVQKTREETEEIDAGFPFRSREYTTAEDLEEPTIIRVNGTKSFLDEQTFFSTPKENIENIDVMKKEEKKKDDYEDEDTSSFLRMMMD